ncbi:hypothetical protein M2310_001413 [Rhizobium leguminosarum]|uniref:Uncharacterized protein n=1 Tax=Rhizobium esperanzae TaxID=1967781 RepID=A0A7W6XV91_9HYPH|nr:hypothetical protein [Rhizobium esperanzae]MDH6200742.1 hypothetical protein [Rhizobium leguminosarum]
MMRAAPDVGKLAAWRYVPPAAPPRTVTASAAPGSSLLGISSAPLYGAGSSPAISAGINAGLPHCLESDGLRVVKQRASMRSPPHLTWRRGRGATVGYPRIRRTGGSRSHIRALAAASRSAIVVRWICALTDCRSISAATVRNELMRRKASLRPADPVGRKPAPPLSSDPSARSHEEPNAVAARQRSVGRLSHGRRSLDDGRTVDPPVFPQANLRNPCRPNVA